MCVVIVPLAGPDFYSQKYGYKALIDINGKALIEAVLKKRPWINADMQSRLIFVLRESEGRELILRKKLAEIFSDLKESQINLAQAYLEKIADNNFEIDEIST